REPSWYARPTRYPGTCARISASTEPSVVPSHSVTWGTSRAAAGATRTSGDGGGGGASSAQASAASSASSARALGGRGGRIGVQAPVGGWAERTREPDVVNPRRFTPAS